MVTTLVMPRAGLTMVEGTIASWTAKEGDAVKKGDVVMEFENEKNTIEFLCTADGFLHITAPEGETVEVGKPIGAVAGTKEEYDALAGGVNADSPGARVETLDEALELLKPALEQAVAELKPAPIPQRGGRVSATGYAKKLARKKGVSLADIRGTGPNGRILADDVRAYRNAPAAAAVNDYVNHGSAPIDVVTKVPWTGIRKAIANNMYNSLQSMAQCTAAAEVDVTDLLAYRQKLVARQEFLGCKITVNDLLSMALVKMLQKHPTANATFDGKTLSTHSAVNLSVAVAAEAGLMVPVVRGADRMSLAELHEAVSGLAARARDKALRDGEQSGGTFTISNVGMFPIDWSTPIINPPQVAIMGFGRAVTKPVYVGDELKPRSMLTMYLTFDHRVLDGLEVGRILKDMRTLLENPELITI